MAYSAAEDVDQRVELGTQQRRANVLIGVVVAPKEQFVTSLECAGPDRSQLQTHPAPRWP